jgi:uncharacterized protein YqgC (DUF456 family)
VIPIILLVLGYGFLLLGLVGLIFPILPGWIFIFVGLLILAKQASWARRALDWLRSRHPRVEAIIDRADTISTRWTRWVTVRLGRLFRPADSRAE